MVSETNRIKEPRINTNTHESIPIGIQVGSLWIPDCSHSWKALPDVLECGGNLDFRIDRGPRYLCNQGATMGYLPAAALDSAMYPLQTKTLRPGESAVAAARREPSAQVSSKRYGDRFDLAAPLCRRTPKQSGIHKEPSSFIRRLRRSPRMKNKIIGENLRNPRIRTRRRPVPLSNFVCSVSIVRHDETIRNKIHAIIRDLTSKRLPF
ncbi:MAG: hypothetical protein [Olavius algarvensis Gamma 1 endosymbiont]|nr:MAG: hypothetical protein [Olavius algarvensis Gamma 1 endosymbiont]